MDVMKAAEMNREEGQEEPDSDDQKCDQRHQRPKVPVEHPVTPGSSKKLSGRLHDSPDDGGVTNHEARKPERPDQIAGTPASPPSDRQSDRKCEGVGPA